MHRIGRTGRCGKTGVATTFINKNSPETVLLDLKQLLIEAKQRIPLVLQTLEGEHEGNFFFFLVLLYFVFFLSNP